MSRVNDSPYEVIRTLYINLKNYKSWDYQDFRIQEEEGKYLIPILEFYLNRGKTYDYESNERENT